MPARLADADVLFCTFPPTNFAEMRKLRWVQIASTGYTQLFGLDLPARGIRATNCRGCFDVPIARVEHRDDGEPRARRPPDDPQPGRGRLGSLRGLSARDPRADGGPVGLRRHRPGDGAAGAANGIARARADARRRRAARAMFTPCPARAIPDGVLPDRVFRAGEEIEFLRGLGFSRHRACR